MDRHKLHRIQVSWPEDLLERMRATAEAENRTMADIIRGAVADYINSIQDRQEAA